MITTENIPVWANRDRFELTVAVSEALKGIEPVKRLTTFNRLASLHLSFSPLTDLEDHEAMTVFALESAKKWGADTNLLRGFFTAVTSLTSASFPDNRFLLETQKLLQEKSNPPLLIAAGTSHASSSWYFPSQGVLLVRYVYLELLRQWDKEINPDHKP